MIRDENRSRTGMGPAYIWPLMSTTRWASALARSNSEPALPVNSLTVPFFSSRVSSAEWSRMKRAVCSSDSKPSSSVMNRILTSGLYLKIDS